MRACRRGEDEDECSLATSGYIAKTLEAPVLQWEKEDEKEEEFLYNKIACNKIKGHKKSSKVMPRN